MPVARRIAVHPYAPRIDQAEDSEGGGKDDAIIEQIEPQLSTSVERCVARKALLDPAAEAFVAADVGEVEVGRVTPDLAAPSTEPHLPAPQAEGYRSGGDGVQPSVRIIDIEELGIVVAAKAERGAGVVRRLRQEARLASGQIEAQRRTHESKLVGPVGARVLSEEGARIVVGVGIAPGQSDPEIQDTAPVRAEREVPFDTCVLDLVEVAGWVLDHLGFIADTEVAQDLQVRSGGIETDKEG